MIELCAFAAKGVDFILLGHAGHFSQIAWIFADFNGLVAIGECVQDVLAVGHCVAAQVLLGQVVPLLVLLRFN